MLFRQTISTLLFITIVTFTSLTQATSAASAQITFSKLTDAYFDTYYFPTNPTIAAQVGIHTYDDRLEDYSKTGITRNIVALNQFLSRFNAIDSSTLNEQDQDNLALVINNIRSQLLTLQIIRPQELNPDYYSSSIAAGAFVIIERNFASTNDRLRVLIAREKLMPSLLLQARNNLKNPPKIYTEIALEQLPGIIQFFQNDVPASFVTATDPTLKKQFTESNAAVIRALINYQTWLQSYLLPRSKGDFRIGAKAFQKKLQYDEMVDTPLDTLLAIGKANLRQNQKEFAHIAKEIDPTKTPIEVLAEISAEHPTSDQLLSSFDSTFATLIKFIKDKKIITIPSDIRPIMQETPPFLRAMTSASMDTPGPFEKVAKEAYFNVTLPNPTWSQQKREEFLSRLSYSAINNISVHETYPGHYTQFLWMHQIHDRVRQILGARTNAEGWAHYCEQMMLDEGFGTFLYGTENTHAANILRLGQLSDALLRDARFIVGIEMHTGKMTFDQAIRFFMKESYQPRIISTMETKRGTSDPTYLYYTLGKLQILKLRQDLATKEGTKFNLQKFHNDFMQQGFPPIKIVRKALLKDDSPTL